MSEVARRICKNQVRVSRSFVEFQHCGKVSKCYIRLHACQVQSHHSAYRFIFALLLRQCLVIKPTRETVINKSFLADKTRAMITLLIRSPALRENGQWSRNYTGRKNSTYGHYGERISKIGQHSAKLLWVFFYS